MSQLERTPESAQKEARIQDLEIAIKKKRTTIKSLRTRLRNLKEDIQQMASESSSIMSRVVERTTRLNQSITNQLRELLDHPKILTTPKQREVVEDLLEQFDPLSSFPEEMMGGDGDPQQEEEQRQSRSEFFASFQQEPEQEEQRDIRKIYLKLSQEFHPDKATNEAENQRNHEMMKQITQAYENHDIAALLEMERLYLDEEREEIAISEAGNLLDANIERLEQELLFLENQATRLSGELKGIRKSDAGQALTKWDRMDRNGVGLESQAAEMEEQLKEMELLQETVADALKAGKMTSDLEEMLRPIDEEDLLEEMMGLFMGGLMEEEEEEDWSAAKFEEGMMVQIAKDKHTRNSGIRKGHIGIVQDVYILENDEFAYELLLEAKALTQVPPHVVEQWVELQAEFGLVLIPESDLKRVPKRKRFDLAAAKAASRTLIIKEFVAQAPFTQAEKQQLQDILLAHPAESDAVNWAQILIPKYIRPNQKAKVKKNPHPHLKASKKAVAFLGINEFDPHDGFIAILKNAKKEFLAPLRYVSFTRPTPEEDQLLKLYRYWADNRLEDHPLMQLGQLFS
ncbi:MAG: hypothetical protein AAF399_21620 [Bacteroidota bacterium]